MSSEGRSGWIVLRSVGQHAVPMSKMELSLVKGRQRPWATDLGRRCRKTPLAGSYEGCLGAGKQD